ncbi:site-specific integrase [Shewanella sp. OPT22]|nr:site-specific integrase [Shewanella sp. OPT22]
MASISNLPSGNFRVQYKQDGKRKGKTFSSELEAKHFAAEIDKKIISDVLTVNCIANAYLDQFSGRGGKEAIGYRLKRLSSFFVGLPLTRFSTQDLQKYRIKRLTEVQSSTVRLELQLLSRLLKYARLTHVLDIPDVFKDYEYPPANKPKDRIVSPLELDMLLGDVSPSMSDIFNLCYLTAMRRSEVVYLRVMDVNLDNRQIYLSNTKNGHSRYVPLSKTACELLARLITGKRSESRLFEVEPHSVSKAFTRSCKRLGIEGLCLHGLRHSAITRYAAKGLSTAQLQVVSGHKDITMLQRYTHLKASDVAGLLD